jgi:hypothetical protein
MANLPGIPLKERKIKLAGRVVFFRETALEDFVGRMITRPTK